MCSYMCTHHARLPSGTRLSAMIGMLCLASNQLQSLCTNTLLTKLEANGHGHGTRMTMCLKPMPDVQSHCAAKMGPGVPVQGT